MAVTAYWIDSGWIYCSAVLDFIRFSTPHTGEAAASLIFSVLEQLCESQRVRNITTENDSHKCSEVDLLRTKLRTIGRHCADKRILMRDASCRW